MVEGPTLLAEAVAAGARIEEVFVAPGGEGPAVEAAAAAGARVHRVDAASLRRSAPSVTPQPVAAVAAYSHVVLDALRPATLLVVGVDVRDPGNAGTLLRSAEAAGADGVVLCGRSVDPYNPKAVRASAGALFHLPVALPGDASPALDQLGSWGLTRWATAAGSGVPYDEADLVAPSALVLGNEAWGLPGDVDDVVDAWLTIPMAGRSESLNVAMAATVLCFEAARQRRRTRPRRAEQVAAGPGGSDRIVGSWSPPRRPTLPST